MNNICRPKDKPRKIPTVLPITQLQKDLYSVTGEIAYAVYIKNIGGNHIDRKVAVFETELDATKWILFIGEGEVIPTRIPPISHTGPDDYTHCVHALNS